MHATINNYSQNAWTPACVPYSNYSYMHAINHYDYKYISVIWQPWGKQHACFVSLKLPFNLSYRALFQFKDTLLTTIWRNKHNRINVSMLVSTETSFTSYEDLSYLLLNNILWYFDMFSTLQARNPSFYINGKLLCVVSYFCGLLVRRVNE